jgi:Sec-independent protein translocase protein TatA
LPELGKGLGKGIREFKDALRGGMSSTEGSGEKKEEDKKKEEEKKS